MKLKSDTFRHLNHGAHPAAVVVDHDRVLQIFTFCGLHVAAPGKVVSTHIGRVDADQRGQAMRHRVSELAAHPGVASVPIQAAHIVLSKPWTIDVNFSH